MKNLILGLVALPTAFMPLVQQPISEVNPEGASQMAATSCRVTNNVFLSGDKFILKIYYNWSAIWLSAGEVVFKAQEEVLDGKPVYHVIAYGQTYKSYEWFYKVRDTYESYMDKETLTP